MKHTSIKDIAGNVVEVGDTVAYCEVKYSILKLGQVLSITPCGITVEKRRNESGKLSRTFDQFILVRKADEQS